jgi:uncharacterized protein
MSLYEKIKNDIDNAFRAGDRDLSNFLKTVISEATAIARKSEVRLPTDAEIITLLRKFKSDAELMATELKKRDRPEEEAKSRAEIEIIRGYLPPEISEEDVRLFVEELRASDNFPAGNAAMGATVKALKEKYGNAFDGKVMTPIVKSVLSL